METTKELNTYPDRNPNPVMTIGENGELVYANYAASIMLKNFGRNGNEKISFPEGFDKCVSLAIESNEIQKETFGISDGHYSFNFCPREDGRVDLFGTNISEEVKNETYFSTISAFSTAILNADTEDEVAITITHEAIARLSYVDCVVYLADRQNGTLKQKAAHGPKNPKSILDSLKDPISLNFGAGIVGFAASEKRTVIVKDISQDGRYTLDNGQRKSEIAVPIMADDEVIGIIDSEHPEKDYFTQEDAKILESIASIASTRIQHTRALEETKHTEAKYKSFVENAFGGLYILRNDLFDYANDQFCEMVGYDLNELTVPNFDMQKLIVDADQKTTLALEARKRGDYSPKSYQLEVKTKQGHLRYLAINTSVLKDKKGYFTLGIALDITETIQSRHRLEEAVESLEKKTEELNEFAHLASHNLRAPVTNLIGLLDHYDRENPADSTNQIILEKFSQTVEQLNLTLEEMHQVLRVRAKESIEFNTVDLNELVEGIKLQLSEKIRTTQFSIQTNFEVNKVKYDKAHLENLFFNLISNSLKYGRQEVNPYIQIHCSEMNDHIRLVFKDNGLGIDLDKHGKHLFGMYKRFHDNPEGRGVGLYLVKRQLNALGGTISAESEPNLGTCFTVFLVNQKNLVK